jgi:hypothetical protein
VLPVLLKDLLPLIFERSNAAQTLWNFEIVVIFGLLGFIASARAIAHETTVKLMLTIAYIVFATGNLFALLNVTEERRILVEAALSKLSEERSLAPSKPPDFSERVLSPPDSSSVIVYHLVIDGFLLGAIWVFPKLRGATGRVKGPRRQPDRA